MVAYAPRGDLASGGEPQLGEDVLHVVLGGAFGDDQPLGDLPVGQALGDQPRPQPPVSSARQASGALRWATSAPVRSTYAVMPRARAWRSASRAADSARSRSPGPLRASSAFARWY